ncbi:putative RNA-directed DNA polymerase from transposon BS [Trichonephila clavipes]|nr:putative RNA-directed DNA polymerase from transposon BS [Trichonephila clavipes]
MFWNFGKSDWPAFAELTEKDFTSLSRSHQLNVNWHNLKEVVIRNAKKTILRGNFKRFKATYMHNDSCLRTLVDKRDRLFQNLKYTNSDSIRIEFNKTNAEIKCLYAVKKRASWHEMICSKIDARTNNFKIWSIAKSLSRDRPQVEVCNTILTADGFPPKDDRTTANILGSHYQKMSRLTFNKDDKNTERQAKLAVHKCRSSDLGDPVFLADFSMHELLLVLNALDKKSPGPDNIHGVMITHLGSSGTQCLLDIFNQSWKSVDDCLTSGKEPLSSPLGNRASNNLLPREQYGFRRGHSTENQILYFCQCVRDAQNLKWTNYTAAAFLDLSEAFDMVWRNKLILKMFDIFGMKGKALPWISDFLKSRVIRVKYNTTLFKDFKLSQAVPQGSVLSLTLFSMFFGWSGKVDY